MIPIVTKINLRKFPDHQRKKICNCKTKCNEGISVTTYNDGMILCATDARKHLYDLINILDDGKYTSWTDQDEAFIVELVKEKGMYRGINRDIAEACGKSYAQAKSKTRRMKEAGRI